MENENTRTTSFFKSGSEPGSGQGSVRKVEITSKIRKGGERVIVTIEISKEGEPGNVVKVVPIDKKKES